MTDDTQKKPAAPAEETAEPAPTPPEDQTSEETARAVAVPRVSVTELDREVERQMRRMSRRSFLWGGVAVVTGYFGWRWLIAQRELDGIPWPFRVGLEIDENLARDYFRSGRLAPTFKRELAKEPKPNGDYGLSDDFDPDSWKLQVIGLADTSQATMKPMPAPAAPHPSPSDRLTDNSTSDKKSGKDKKAPVKNKQAETTSSADSGADQSDNSDQKMTAEMPVVSLTLEDIKKLHREDIVTELKCIEGWSTIVHWTGVRFAEFVALYPPADIDGAPPAYVSIETPDGEYYVGLDMESALHPQTLLCYEMNGQPLTLDHGAPLRLVIPVKYGIKNIKRIGTIRFTSERPKDYWAEQGYDWYAGH